MCVLLGTIEVNDDYLNLEYRYSKYHMFVFCCRWSRSTRTDRGGRDGRAGGGRFGMEAIVVHTPVLLGTLLLQVSMSKSLAYCSQCNLSLSSHSVNPVPNWTRSLEKGYGLASDTAAELKFVAWFYWVLIRLVVHVHFLLLTFGATRLHTFALMSTKGSVILNEPSLYRGQVQSLKGSRLHWSRFGGSATF